jgi:hypothetical protein
MKPNYFTNTLQLVIADGSSLDCSTREGSKAG